MSLASPTAIIGYDQRHASSSSRMTLPRIEHPSKRSDDDDRQSLDIRGRSRDGQGDGKLIRKEFSATPELPRRRRRSSSYKTNSKSWQFSEPLNDIPENVNTTFGEDREKVRLPIFGHRSESALNGSKDRETPLTSRIIIDELETSLREKVRSQMSDVRTKFRHASQNETNGKINRQALQHLIGTIFGTQKQISPSHMEKLLERLNLKYSNKISFDDFLQSLFNDEENVPDWISSDPSPSVREESSSKRTATQMFLILKEKVRTKHKDLVSLVPALNGGSSSRIFKAQFHHALLEMGYRMKDQEFEKLWDKFDTDGFKAVPSEKFLKTLTNESVGDESIISTNHEDFNDQQTFGKTHRETPRENTARVQLNENQIEKWLNHKFPHGFSDLEKSLERLDTKQMGTLPRDRFLEELKRFGLKLEGNLLEYFLKRLNVDLTLTNDGIPYRDVINAFKQKSDLTRKRINADNQSPPEDTRQTSLEKQIDFVLAMNYERVRDLFHRLDTRHHGRISANQLRSIIEDLLEYILKADEYYQLLKQIPMDENGRVKYKEYLKQVLDRSLDFQEQKSSRTPQYQFSSPTKLRERINSQQLKEKKRQQLNELNESSLFSEDGQQKIRSLEELRLLLKSLIRIRYKDIEEEFKKIDRGSYGELTPDLLFDLFKRLSLQPEVTRSEVDLIWSRCHLKRDGNLDFYQFLREFGYSKRSAHYPNAKENPPKRGDADLILTSNKLYGDSILVHGTAKNAIRSNWNELRREFAELDPYRTGFIQCEEFDDILTELCSSVNQEDLHLLKSKFQTPNDSRMNYVRFLKRYAPVPEFIGLVDQPMVNPLPAVTQKSPRAASDRSNLSLVSNKLRRKLSDSYKQLRRTFKQQDTTNSGSIPVKILQEILNQYKCSLNDEQFYTLISQIDTKMDGTINYNYFLQNYVKSN